MSRYDTKIGKITAAVVVAVSLLLPFQTALAVSDADIAAAQAQAAAAASQASQLHAQATDAKTKIADLQGQISALQSQIRLNQLQADQLQGQIDQAQKDMADKKATLAENIKTMYVNGQTSALEMLASSKDLSQFFNLQQYQDAVKNKIEESVAAITKLKAQLDSQKKDLDAKLADQQSQKSSLDTQSAQMASLATMLASNAAAADQSVKDSNAHTAALKAQQQAELAAQFSGSGASGGAACGGGYPAKWCNAPQDTVVDAWGMYNRECVSYTAYKVAASGRYMPYWGGSGNANQWPGNAQSAGISVDHAPKVGDVAISMSGYYGHAMYVEAVFSNGSIHVSQYNYDIGSGPGRYSEMTIAAGNLYFIHF